MQWWLHKVVGVCNAASTVNGPRGNRETREAILDAPDRLLTTRGFRSVTMDDIAGEAGVSRRTIYMYFPSKNSDTHHSAPLVSWPF